MTKHIEFVRVKVTILEDESEFSTLMVAGLELFCLNLPPASRDRAIKFNMPLGVLPHLRDKAAAFVKGKMKRMAKRQGYKVDTIVWAEYPFHSPEIPDGLAYYPKFRLVPWGRLPPMGILPEGYTSAYVN